MGYCCRHVKAKIIVCPNYAWVHYELLLLICEDEVNSLSKLFMDPYSTEKKVHLSNATNISSMNTIVYTIY